MFHSMPAGGLVKVVETNKDGPQDRDSLIKRRIRFEMLFVIFV